MQADRELELTRELGELQAEYSLIDKSEENLQRGQRIREIREELNLICSPRADRRKSVLRWK